MPLRDHFHPPLVDQRSWEELHGAWPSTIAFRLNAMLPPRYYSGVRVHLGTAVELDVAAFQRDHAGGSVAPSNGDTALSWAPASPALLLETEAYRREATLVEGYFFHREHPPQHPTVLDLMARG